MNEHKHENGDSCSCCESDNIIELTGENGETLSVEYLATLKMEDNQYAIMKACDENEELRNNLSAAAHLIHGSSEGRFSITYCPGKEKDNLSQAEIESVGFLYADIDEVTARYNPETLKDGVNILPDGEEIFYISNPALGLWAFKDRFKY